MKIREASTLITFIDQKTLIAKLLATVKTKVSGFVQSLTLTPAYATA